MSQPRPDAWISDQSADEMESDHARQRHADPAKRGLGWMGPIDYCASGVIVFTIMGSSNGGSGTHSASRAL